MTISTTIFFDFFCYDLFTFWTLREEKIKMNSRNDNVIDTSDGGDDKPNEKLPNTDRYQIILFRFCTENFNSVGWLGMSHKKKKKKRTYSY